MASLTPEIVHLNYQLRKVSEHERGYNIMIGNVPDMYTIGKNQRSIKKLFIPIKFWFCGTMAM